MKTYRFICTMVFLLTLVYVFPVYAGKYALIIGNGSYSHPSIPTLDTPVNDANVMASVLGKLGFSVAKGTDMTQQEMEEAIRNFRNHLDSGDTALFYYSGHGVEVEGINFLIPVEIAKDMIRYKGVPVNAVLDKMEEAQSRVNIIILDACRSSLKGGKGFGKGLSAMTGGEGTYIAYATSPGMEAYTGTGSTSIFTRHLTAHIETPGLKIEDMFKRVRKGVMDETGKEQKPWDSTMLTGDVYLADSGGTTIVTPPPVVPPPPQREPETASLTVTCDTPGAAVEVNGQAYGKAPQNFIIKEAGTYTVKVSAAGYKPYTKKEKIALGDTVTVTAYLEKERPAAVSVPDPAPAADSKKFTNSIGQEFVYIQPGTFIMGSPENEPGHESDEKQHKVTLTKGFYMQTTEVTQGQWKAVMGNNPSYFKDCGDDCPVENVSWEDAQEFIKKLNRKEGKEYRLPTEAEWEYAARAGTSTPFHTGRCLSTDQANYDGNYPLEGCSKGKYREKTVAVASFSANAWGLYDMHGNVWEWCQDWYGDYPAGSVTNPEGSSTGSDRVFRGGGWGSFAVFCRSAGRDWSTPGSRGNDLGFRLVLSPQVSR